MPHCIVEYSRDLESQIAPTTLVKIVHQGALASGLFETSHIKTRAIGYDYFSGGRRKVRLYPRYGSSSQGQNRRPEKNVVFNDL